MCESFISITLLQPLDFKLSLKWVQNSVDTYWAWWRHCQGTLLPRVTSLSGWVFNLIYHVESRLTLCIHNSSFKVALIVYMGVFN